MRVRCTTCRHGELYTEGTTRAPNCSPANVFLCPECGGKGWDDPRPGRRVSAAVWWKPWTWGTTRWEWRDDHAMPMPAAPLSGLRLILGGEE
jgi:hypothetical protein